MADQQTAALAWLVGGDHEVATDRLEPAGAIAGSAGVLRRLLQYYAGDPVGPDQQLTVTTATGLGRVDAANSAIVTVETQPVRVRFDGLAATTANGLLLPVGTVLRITGQASINSASFISTVAGGVIHVAFFS